MRLPQCWNPEVACARAVGAYALALVMAAGCAHLEPQPPSVVAILPVEVVGVESEQGELLRRVLENEATALGSIQLVPPGELDAALARATPAGRECLGLEPCLLKVGVQLQASRVLALSLAGLGPTALVRSRLFDTAQGLALQDLQETVVGGREALPPYAADLMRRLFPVAPVEAWYQRPWVWIAGGVALAVVVGGSTLYGTRGSDDSGVTHIGDL